MALVTGRHTINHIDVLEVDGDPSTGGGTQANPGSLASPSTGAGLWVKTGAGDTAWTLQAASGSPSGWTDDGSTVRLTTSTDKVAIGRATVDTNVRAQIEQDVAADQILLKLTASGNANAYLRLLNLQGSLSRLAPAVDGHADNTADSGLQVRGIVTTDTGAIPASNFVSMTTAGAALTTRPLFRWQSGTTTVMQMAPSADLALTIPSGASGSLGLTINDAGGGADPAIKFQVLGTSTWTLGTDNAEAGDPFKISRSAVVGASPFFRISQFGDVSVGPNATDAVGVALNVQDDQNDLSELRITNSTAGTASVAALSAVSNAGGVRLEQLSSSYTTVGLFLPDYSRLAANTSSSGLIIVTEGTAKPIIFGQSSTEVARFSGASGNFLVGTSTDPSRRLVVSSAAATDGIRIINTGVNSDPVVEFDANGSVNIAMGVDESDSLKLKFGLSAITSGTFFTYDPINKWFGMGEGTSTPLSAIHVKTTLDTEIILDKGVSSNGGLILKNNGTDALFLRLDLNENFTIENEVSDADIIVKVNDGGTDTEMMRFDASTSRIGVRNATPTAVFDVSNGTAGISGDPILTARSNTTAVLTASSAGYLTSAPIAATSGATKSWLLDAPAHTGQTASTEVIDLDIDLARTVTWATGALTTQRAVVVRAPTYNTGAAITTAATVAITGAPVASGGGTTIATGYSLWSQDGAVLLQDSATGGLALSFGDSFSSQFAVQRLDAELVATFQSTTNDATVIVSSAATARLWLSGTNCEITTSSGPVAIDAELELLSSLTIPRTAVNNSNYTITDSDYLVAYTAIGATRTVSLPSAVGRAGRVYEIKDESGSAGSFNIVIDPIAVGETIDGAASYSISTARGSARVYSNGTNWFILSTKV